MQDYPRGNLIVFTTRYVIRLIRRIRYKRYLRDSNRIEFSGCREALKGRCHGKQDLIPGLDVLLQIMIEPYPGSQDAAAQICPWIRR